MGSEKSQFFNIVEILREQHPLSLLLHHANVSRSGYYKWQKNKERECRDATIESHIMAIHSIRPFYGYRRMAEALRREGLVVNRKRVLRLMRKLNLRSTIRKKRKYFSSHEGNVFPNLLKRDFKIDAPGIKYVTDITYIPTINGFIYLSAIQDLYNNEIVAYSFSGRNDLELVLKTLEKLPPAKSAILHSDQGVQYIHKEYKAKLEKLSLRGSHSRKANCLDNACIESFFSHFKTEAFPDKKFLSVQDTIDLAEKYIAFYNSFRFQKRLGQLSPVEYREKLAA